MTQINKPPAKSGPGIKQPRTYTSISITIRNTLKLRKHILEDKNIRQTIFKVLLCLGYGIINGGEVTVRAKLD